MYHVALSLLGLSTTFGSAYNIEESFAHTTSPNVSSTTYDLHPSPISFNIKVSNIIGFGVIGLNEIVSPTGPSIWEAASEIYSTDSHKPSNQPDTTTLKKPKQPPYQVNSTSQQVLNMGLNASRSFGPPAATTLSQFTGLASISRGGISILWTVLMVFFSLVLML